MSWIKDYLSIICAATLVLIAAAICYITFVPLYERISVVVYKRKAMRASAEYTVLIEMNTKPFSETTLHAIPTIVLSRLEKMEVECEDQKTNRFISKISPYTTGCLLTQTVIDALYNEIGEDIYARETEKESELP